MSLSEKMLDIRKQIESTATSYGISKVGYAPLIGIPVQGELLAKARGWPMRSA